MRFFTSACVIISKKKYFVNSFFIFFYLFFQRLFFIHYTFLFTSKNSRFPDCFFCLFTFGLIPLSRFLNSFFNTGFNFQSQFCSFHVFIFIIIHRFQKMHLYNHLFDRSGVKSFIGIYESYRNNRTSGLSGSLKASPLNS